MHIFKLQRISHAQGLAINFEGFLPLIVLNVKIVANGHQFLAHLVTGCAAALGTHLAIFFPFLSFSSSHLGTLLPIT
jgi:hypothetical protein